MAGWRSTITPPSGRCDPARLEGIMPASGLCGGRPVTRPRAPWFPPPPSPPLAGSAPHNLDALLGVLSLPREGSHARDDLPTPPSHPPAPGQPARRNPRSVCRLPDRTGPHAPRRPPVSPGRRALRPLAGGAARRGDGRRPDDGLGPPLLPRPPGGLLVPGTVPSRPHQLPRRDPPPVAHARRTRPDAPPRAPDPA